MFVIYSVAVYAVLTKKADDGRHFVRKLSSIVFIKEKALSTDESVIVGYIL